MNAPPTRTLPPSSGACAAEFRPRASTRAGVVVSSWLLLLAGAVVVLHVEISALVRAVLLVAWCAGVGRGIARLGRGQARVRRLRLLPDGRCLALSAGGEVHCLQLLGGTVVGRTWAWLRFRFDDGLVYAELLWVRQVEASAWRRLHVIWRWGQ